MTMEASEIPADDTHSLQSQSESNNNNNQSKVKEDGSGDGERVLPSGEPSDITTHKEDAQQIENPTKDEDEVEVLDLGDTSCYDAEQRSVLFQRALDYEKKGKRHLALQLYLGCIKGLQRMTNFVLLPECLHNIADLYETQGDYEKAIHFAQAEKLFYESALIESQDIQKKLDEVVDTEDSNSTKDLNDLNVDAMRAEEYEHLARLCLDNNQATLALEYAGKCAKIRQRVYGDSHAKTKETLDFFASLYAEVGKEQYSDSFTLLNNVTSEEYQSPQVIMSPSPGGEPVSILRQRATAVGQKKDESSAGQAEREKKQVRFHESVTETNHADREEMASLTVTLILLIVCFIILMALGVWLFCSIDKGHTCYHISSRVQSWIMKVRYFFHTHSNPKVAFSS